jgi:hypothetical protein
MKVMTTTIPTRFFRPGSLSFLSTSPFFFSFPFLTDCKVPLCKVATLFFLLFLLAVQRDLMYGIGILAWSDEAC